jgi:5-methylthioadenosine/S-adenosylhomocysteine deaminase
MATQNPIDPLDGPPLVLAGDIVTMDGRYRVIRGGRLYVENGNVVAARPAGHAPPPGFSAAKLIDTGGTLFPGLIELHNHLAYNVLPLWQVPKKYVNRGQWAGTAQYRKLVTAPMTVLGDTTEYLPALIRYVETKCLLGGVTTSQGIQLFSNAGIRRFYRGIVRNVEQTEDAALPEAMTRVADLEAADASAFLERLKKQTCMLLHLSEGIGPTARKHFSALEIGAGVWAITPALAGIHAAGLTAADFATLGAHGGAMIWSPLSNLLLYGDTSDVAAAKRAKVRIGIGPDWSVSGSKNLLGELKAAYLWSEAHGIFKPRELVAMATRVAAKILQWDKAIGSLQRGKRADVLAIQGTAKDPYRLLLQSRELDIALVVVNGIPRYGTPELMRTAGTAGTTVKVGGQSRRLFLKQTTQDPLVQGITLAQARRKLATALGSLPKLAKKMEQPQPRASRSLEQAAPKWRLVLDELHDSGVDLRHHLDGSSVARPRTAARAAKPLSELVERVMLDPLTAVDDPDFFDCIDRQLNLPEFIKIGLRQLYGAG